MRLLIDTHIFLWLTQASNQLATDTLSAIQNPENQSFVSFATRWEMQIKYAIGKLTLPTSVRQFFLAQRRILSLQTITITQQHIWTLGTLPHHHRDPFDRMLIAQAIQGDMTLVSVDPVFAQYLVRLFGLPPQP